MESEHPTSTACVESVLQSRGLRCTRQRIAIYEALIATHCHPTAEQLHQLVAQDDQSLSLATVYNTLETFCSVGLTQKLPGKSREGSTRYDATLTPHLHARCQETGEVTDVPEDLSQRILDRIPRCVLHELEQRMGFKVDQVHIELIGEKR